MSKRESTGGAGLAGEGTSTEGRSTWSRRQGKGHCLGAKRVERRMPAQKKWEERKSRWCLMTNNTSD